MVTGRHAPPLTGDQFLQEADRLHALGWHIQSWESVGNAHWRILRVLPRRPNSQRQLDLPLLVAAPVSAQTADVVLSNTKKEPPYFTRRSQRAAHWFHQMRLAAEGL